MANKEYEVDNHNHARSSVTTQINKQNVVPSEPQLGYSKTLHVSELLPMPRSHATAGTGQTTSNA